MSIDRIKSVFENIETCDAWSLQLLQINNSRRNGTTYCGREITLSPEGALSNFLREISKRYCSGDKCLTKVFEDVTEYDGSAVNKTIYRLESENELVATTYDALIDALANPDTEVNPLGFSAQAYVLRGRLTIGENETAVKLFSMQNPVVSLRHKFLHSSGTFREITDKVISLRTTVDVVIIEDTIYMLTLAGENLFAMERAYKVVCSNKVNDIVDANIVSDTVVFKKEANSGHNPRKFVSFNEAHLQRLNDVNIRNMVSEKFGIPLLGDKFDTNQPGVSDKIVKLLCERGMVDPFDNNPMEVSSSKRWV